MSSAELVAIADRLYAESADTFVRARDDAARACADKVLAAQVKALRKPSVAAWAVNLLVRREADQIEQVLALAGSLRTAAESLDGDELRALTRQRRQLTSALTTTARSLARESGVRLTPAVADQVEAMLNAAMLDPAAAAVLRSGLVLTGFTSTGVSELDLGRVCAVPDAVGHVATRVESPEPVPPVLHVVPDDAADRRAEELAEATTRVEEATGELAEIEASLEDLNARRLQLQGEMDELRRRLVALEDSVDEVDEDLEEARQAREEAGVVLEEAERTLASLRRR